MRVSIERAIRILRSNSGSEEFLHRNPESFGEAPQGVHSHVGRVFAFDALVVFVIYPVRNKVTVTFGDNHYEKSAGRLGPAVSLAPTDLIRLFELQIKAAGTFFAPFV